VFSLQSSLDRVGHTGLVTGDARKIADSARIILPGVGAFPDAARKLRETGLFDVVLAEVKKGKPLLGICLGMQLLFDKSYEYGETDGLGLLPGVVAPIKPLLPQGAKVPHMGWNSLVFTEAGRESALFRHIPDGADVYFVHSFSAQQCDSVLLASTDYSGAQLTAAAGRENVLGCQFHPEKSGETGLRILTGFCEL
jgi:glutamine amidotransferase